MLPIAVAGLGGALGFVGPGRAAGLPLGSGPGPLVLVMVCSKMISSSSLAWFGRSPGVADLRLVGVGDDGAIGDSSRIVGAPGGPGLTVRSRWSFWKK